MSILNTRRDAERTMPAVLLVVLIFILQMTAQLASTPLGEGMDSYGHWSYIAFFAHESRPPRINECSMSADIVRLSKSRAPASRQADTYIRWAALSPVERAAAKADILQITPAIPYVEINTQSQHPPLYYAIMSLPYRLVRNLNLEQQAFVLGFLSILIAATAFPAIYLTLRRFLCFSSALFLTASIAWFPNLLSYLGRISNDTLAFALYAWLAYLLSCEDAAKKHQILAGVVLTFGIMTKSYFLTAVPVYFIAVAVFSALHGDVTPRSQKIVRPFLLSMAVLLPPLIVNYLYSGHLLPMRQFLRTSDSSLVSKFTEMLHIDPVWFFSGLAKGFFWSGFWSFVSPGFLFYLPLLALPFLFLFRLIRRPALFALPELRKLGVHYGVILCFLAGLWVYAGLFRIDALGQGRSPTQGNEGWYLDVLFGSITAILAAWLSLCLGAGNTSRTLKTVLGVMVLWNLWARLTMIAFWSGTAEPLGRLRSISPIRMIDTLREGSAWDNWLSLPGIATPVALTTILPLVLALSATLVLVVKYRKSVADMGAPIPTPGSGTTSLPPETTRPTGAAAARARHGNGLSPARRFANP